MSAKVPEGKLGKESSSKWGIDYEVLISPLHLSSCEWTSENIILVLDVVVLKGNEL